MPDYVPEFLRGAPVWQLIVFLFVVVVARSHGTYWLGRGVAAGAVRSRWADKLSSQRFTRGRDALAKWGWPVVPFAYLTVGFQTAVMASAGFVQMKYWKFLLASLPGCVLWAVIYGVGGLTVFMGGLQLALRSPWLAAGAILAIAVIVAGIVMWRRRAATRATPATPPLQVATPATPVPADEPA